MLFRSVRDFSELLDSNLAPPAPAHTRAWRVAYHPPCSLQHGQRVSGVVEEALLAAGFKLAPFAEQHLCCGSAGSYSLLQPALSEALRARKVQALKASGANVAVTGNIGCLAQLSGADALPIVHLAELLDYAAGGILPAPLKGLARENDPR
mgnify:FL=1